MRPARLGGVAFALMVGLGAGATGAQTPSEARTGDHARAERRVRERIAALVQRRLALTDEQLRRLQATNRKFEPQRFALLQRERAARADLRRELLAGNSADQQRVSADIAELLELQRRRLALLEAEQAELAQYLTPVQRAKYLALQDHARRRFEHLRGERRSR